MNCFTATIPLPIAKKLKEKGYWNPGCTISSQYNNACYFKDGRLYEDGAIADWEDIHPAPTYAEVFDWLMEKGIQILLFWDNDGRNIGCDAEVWSSKSGFTELERKVTWHEAANAAIEMALTLF